MVGRLPFSLPRGQEQQFDAGAAEAYSMNVVIFGKGFGKPRQLNLSGLRATGFVAVCTLVVCSVGFAVGYLYSSLTGSGVSITEVSQLTDELQLQRDNIDTIRQGNEDTLDALAIRIAQMNADFDSVPALGGPEEPVVTGSNVAIPEIVESMQSLDDQLNNREAQLGVLESVLMGQNLNDRVYPQGRPVNSGWISSYFGKRTDPFTGKPANHTGIDFAGKLGDQVVAVADGVVTWSADRYGYGVMVELNHGNGYSTRYAHNAENLVTVGDEVKKGQAVARMGETGRATGPNLHFEVLKNGRRVNPVSFIRDSSK
jgi:murein DD-endopeptidase MepM/ murein hydrolase activator NlpD